eukprot:TRINITY_DN4068_c0_g1_i3.p1 TRINITY_DN4068_c0_g1~~TRINITY_DN4068_c0_g1_i3.p1  ORF type:complete len:510 (-),score=78.83 TRINITY_DN4068_c0_g1_i3:1407-2885(-)
MVQTRRQKIGSSGSPNCQNTRKNKRSRLNDQPKENIQKEEVTVPKRRGRRPRHGQKSQSNNDGEVVSVGKENLRSDNIQHVNNSETEISGKPVVNIGTDEYVQEETLENDENYDNILQNSNKQAMFVPVLSEEDNLSSRDQQESDTSLDFEHQRQLNIIRNREMLEKLDLNSCIPQAPKRQFQIRRVEYGRQRRAQIQESDLRRSSRKRSKPVSYIDMDDAVEELGRKKRSRTRQFSANPSQRSYQRFDGWNPLMLSAGHKGQEQALEDAVNFLKQKEVEDVGDVKQMTPSMISGGFWCSLNKSFARIMDKRDGTQGGYWNYNRNIANNTRTVDFVVEDQDHQFIKKAEGIVLLGKGNDLKKQNNPVSYGFSGGWRGFAIDQLLYPGDSVSMWRISERQIGICIFRAMKYEKGDAWQPGDILNNQEQSSEENSEEKNQEENDEEQQDEEKEEEEEEEQEEEVNKKQNSKMEMLKASKEEKRNTGSKTKRRNK